MNYQTGQSVIYRNKGVYTIESIGKVAFLPDSEKIYYTLRPVFRSGDEHIYVPTDKEDALRHSLSAQEKTLPSCLRVIGRGDDEVMAIEHCSHPTYGVQFHPESIMTPNGKTMLENFLKEN